MGLQSNVAFRVYYRRMTSVTLVPNPITNHQRSHKNQISQENHSQSKSRPVSSCQAADHSTIMPAPPTTDEMLARSMTLFRISESKVFNIGLSPSRTWGRSLSRTSNQTDLTALEGACRAPPQMSRESLFERDVVEGDWGYFADSF